MRTTVKSYDDIVIKSNDILLAVDLQNDFATGVLGNPDAEAIIPGAARFIKRFPGRRVFTKDTHQKGLYFHSLEGKNLPILHTVEDTEGWELVPAVKQLLGPNDIIICKSAFGAAALSNVIKDLGANEDTDIYVLGLDTGYCDISNVVLLRTFFPDTRIHVLSGLCACATKESHETALAAMSTLFVEVIDLEM